MPKFRKKPVVIDAVRWDQSLDAADQIEKWAAESEKRADTPVEYRNGFVFIDTLEGEMEARLGDWIIRGVNGELYPCKPDIFEATYEPA